MVADQINQGDDANKSSIEDTRWLAAPILIVRDRVSSHNAIAEYHTQQGKNGPVRWPLLGSVLYKPENVRVQGNGRGSGDGRGMHSCMELKHYE